MNFLSGGQWPLTWPQKKVTFRPPINLQAENVISLRSGGWEANHLRKRHFENDIFNRTKRKKTTFWRTRRRRPRRRMTWRTTLSHRKTTLSRRTDTRQKNSRTWVRMTQRRHLLLELSLRLVVFVDWQHKDYFCQFWSGHFYASCNLTKQSSQFAFIVVVI